MALRQKHEYAPAHGVCFFGDWDFEEKDARNRSPKSKAPTSTAAFRQCTRAVRGSPTPLKPPTARSAPETALRRFPDP